MDIKGDKARAEKNVRENIPILIRVFGSDSPDVWAAENFIAVLLFQKNDINSSEKLVRKTLAALIKY